MWQYSGNKDQLSRPLNLCQLNGQGQNLKLTKLLLLNYVMHTLEKLISSSQHLTAVTDQPLGVWPSRYNACLAA